MRKFLIVISLLTLLLLAVGGVAAQAPDTVLVSMNSNEFVYSGPGTNAAIYELIAAGRVVEAAGRNADGTWVQINMNGQIVGWVPANTVTFTQGTLANLGVRGGLLDMGNGAYRADNPTIRAAEVQLILIQRPLRLIGARYFRLQAFLGASCTDIPAPPNPPSISDRQVGAVPELDQVRRELTYVQEQTAQAIAIYGELCAFGGNISTNALLAGVAPLNNAYNAYDNVRKLLDTITGLEYVAG